MEVPAGQDGIQQLLLAEQEAQAIVAKARKGKDVKKY
jgi:Vacuolar (H+)-ATPase G subunit